ncbi:MAG: hypothetical protein EBT36_11905 [Betaproteobacteria bacterium]|jgi:hypothetical protein|nr:hypothetical protein [Pseudomonadota bacterium]NBO04850.1 hypothetical protein [Betaproteobacteria bacterium]NBO95258.1 hypothetical protein [Betaproteobacteria bacterium]NBP36006.1 hypothetical protein [Betaproteobacteria bacterium]NBP38767.1 hypothetical protein [Betaproteobacteria bacterium]
MLLGASVVKLIAEIALMALLGRGLVAVLAGARRDTNFFYQILTLLTKPFESLVRLITPRIVIDRHIPLVTFFIMVMIWFAALFAKINACLTMGVELCK